MTDRPPVRRRPGLERLAVAALLALFAGLGAVHPSRAADDVVPEGAGPAPLSLSWRSQFPGIQSVSSVALRVQARERVSIALELTSEGLDFRTVGRAYGAFDLKPGESREVSVRLVDVPLQGVSYSSQVAVLARTTRADGTTLTQRSPEFHAHFSEDHSRAFVYSGETMERELNGGQLTGDAFALMGRIWTGERFEDVADVRRREFGGDPPPQAGPHGGFGIAGGVGPAPVQGYPIEVDWTTYFLDAGHGEDFANTLGAQKLDASYASAKIGRVVQSPCAATSPSDPCVQIVWQGHLDADGRTKVPSPVPGASYFLWIYSEMKKGSTTASVHYWTDRETDSGVRRWRLSFSIPPGLGPVTTPALAVGWHRTSNAAAVMSRLFQVPDLVQDSGGSFRIHANKGCPTESTEIPADDACAPGTTVYTGPWTRTADGEPGSLQSKYVVAHEAGHAAMALGPGNPRNDYHASQTWNLCKCNHVTASNRLHCLQSAEYASTAQVEGFAHFAAARLFNRPTDGDCQFNYYKEFLPVFGPTKTPPVNVSCRNPVAWRDHRCPNASFGTEYDWMQFYWNVSTGVNASGVTDLYDIYTQACGGSCSGVNVTWDDLVGAASTHFGAFDPHALKFLNDGDTCGVDETP
jgi:hypothetical protein